MDKIPYKYFKIEVYLPEEALENIVKALNAAGAGFVGNYDYVFATTKVNGHWRPLAGASPYQGEIGQFESASEIKLEIDCAQENISNAIHAIRNNHPYEEPLIRVMPLLNEFFE